MALNAYLSIITLNVNGLNAPTKRHWVAEWIRKQDPHIYCLQEIYISKGVEKIFHVHLKCMYILPFCGEML